MPEFYHGKIPIIRRSLNDGFVHHGAPDEVSYGCVPRDYSVDPVEMRDSPDGMKLYAESEWDAVYDEQEAQESSLEHIYLRGDKPAFEFLDQGKFPDCWAHSTAHAIMLDQMKQNLPITRLNAVAVATLMGRTDGGWSGASMKFARENGFPVIGNGPGEWPYQSRNGRDTPELRANMAKHKALEDWYDLGRQVWDQKLSRLQLATVGSSNLPTPTDYNAYAHAMCMLRWVRLERDAWGRLTLNSWLKFGYFGLCVIPESTASVSNACSLRSSMPLAA